MTLRLAFAGFRHSHILELYKLAAGRDDVEIVAACEEDPQTRQQYKGTDSQVRITHESYDDLYGDVDFDAVAVGDYYGRRGEIIRRALSAGKHVIADKPVCTSLGELHDMTVLAGAKKLAIGCQLSLRGNGNYLALREAVRSGRIGQPITVTFTGQHPLMRGKRPGWYFEPGKHGGTINDIAIHGVDAIEWITGRRITTVVAARAWNANVHEAPHFQDCGQVMLQLDNGGGVIGDVSYLAPEKFGYKSPQYWRMTVHGTNGYAETSLAGAGVEVCTHQDESPTLLPPLPAQPESYFQAFLDEIAGRANQLSLTTAQVLQSTRIALTAQRAADANLRDVAI